MATPPREHYEAQVLGPSACDEATVLALEVGFHAEHPDPARNQAVLDRMLAAEDRWRPTLGPEAEAGPFLGRRDDWRRLSELWADPDLSDPAMGFEIASRLTDYLVALEPCRRAGTRPVVVTVGRGLRDRGIVTRWMPQIRSSGPTRPGPGTTSPGSAPRNTLNEEHAT